METRTVRDLKPGDMIDLERDLIADPNGDKVEFQSEYAIVGEIVEETPACIVVYIDGVDAFGFPPDHMVRWAGHDSGYNA